MRWLTQRKEFHPRLGPAMTSFTYYLFDQGANMITAEAANHEDIVNAFDRMRTLLDKFEMIATVQLWQDEEFVAQIKRSEGRLILKKNGEPAPVHPLAQPLPKSKAS
ncbi:MAG TPA: hypothetical protein VN728_02840 [Stellaceae bacterium]|jgi:hypothetical protein|nr:hypothetical protein [Stellaceae bacterium]